jgi:TPR repeat protein
MVSVARPQQADEAARLTVSAKDAGANAAAVIGGLAPGSALSAGTQVGPNTWRLSVEELTSAAITPPLGFVGTMDLSVELHLANNIVVDRKALQIQWSGKSVLAPAASNCNSERTAADGLAPVDACGSANDPTSVDAAQPPMLSATDPSRPSEPARDPSEIAAKMKIGRELVAHGDITAARTMFQRAAEAGEAAGAFALAETYDSAVLRRLPLRGGIAPDLALARSWYEQARAMGSTAAAERIVRLTQVSR